jgi:hypothetical protein
MSTHTTSIPYVDLNDGKISSEHSRTPAQVVLRRRAGPDPGTFS